MTKRLGQKMEVVRRNLINLNLYITMLALSSFLLRMKLLTNVKAVRNQNTCKSKKNDIGDDEDTEYSLDIHPLVQNIHPFEIHSHK